MTEVGFVGLSLIIITTIFSYKGFTNAAFYDRYRFEVDKILIEKDYKRIITSGFLHSGWMHLLFNMFCLYSFGGFLEHYLGAIPFLLIYLAGLVGGELLSLYIHRNHGAYSSIGASGAVCGVIFASIALFPGMKIGFFILPLAIPAWIYGLLFVAYTIYGIRSQRGNTGHDAHLGGALIGMTAALLMHPSAFTENLLVILLIALPALTFIYFIATRPHVLLTGNYRVPKKKYYTIDDTYNASKLNREKELDAILDKINKKGMAGLTKKEKELLEQYSQMR